MKIQSNKINRINKRFNKENKKIDNAKINDNIILFDISISLYKYIQKNTNL